MPQPNLHAEALVDSIGNQLSDASASIGKLDNLSHYLSHDRDLYHEEYEFTEMEFRDQLERIDASIRMALEALALPYALEKYAREFEKYEPTLTKLSLLPFIGELHCDTLRLYWQYHANLAILVGKDIAAEVGEQELRRFERILANTPKIVKDRKIEPSNESEVRKCVYELLIHVFPDAVREIPVAQVTKTYKPDIGVQSLKAAAEYKFADTEEEVKSAIGGLYEDMRGYNGTADWQYFYAVVYMTDAFFTPEQIKAEFKHTKADDNWKPILVFGRGGRKKPAGTT